MTDSSIFMKKMQDKNIVVTGASSGIGRAIAYACAKEGANVVVHYCQSADKAEEVVTAIQQLGRQAHAIQADMADVQAIKKLVDLSLEAFPKIDVWVNNAGADILTGRAATMSDHEKLQQLINVDLLGTIHACWLIAPYMQQQGHGNIINISWDLALHGFHGVNPQMFAAAKSGVLGFSYSFAKTVAPLIRTNVICPGWIKTAFANDVMDNEYYQDRLKEIPLKRFGTPEDVAAVAVFLGSDGSSYLTGEAIKVNGGLV